MMMNLNELKKIYLKSEKQLIKNKIIPILCMDYNEIEKKNYNRTTTLEIKNYLKIWEKVNQIWDRITIIEFTKLIAKIGDLPGPYSKFQTAICLLYQITEGKSNFDMSEFIPESTYRRIYEKIYDDKDSSVIIKEWSNNWYESFSNPIVRNLYSKIYNPDELKSITLIMDGKDIITLMDKIDNTNVIENGFNIMLSRKNKKGGNWQKGIKACFLIDSRGYCLNMTPVYGALEKYDGHLAPELNLLEIMDKNDVISADHHFDKFLKDLFSEENDENSELSDPITENNYILKPVKKKNLPLNPDELDRKAKISAYLSKIEVNVMLFYLQNAKYLVVNVKRNINHLIKSN
jgi:hypothetical protein